MSKTDASNILLATHANNSYRFVQLSDPHLSSIWINHPLQLCNKRILGYLSWLKKRRKNHPAWILQQCLQTIEQINADHTVITGDMTHIGLPAEFDQVAYWLAQHFNAQDTTVIPGNHDLYVEAKWANTFAKWQPYMCSDTDLRDLVDDTPAFAESIESYYPVIRVRPPLVYIGISSVFPAPWGKATGRVSAVQLERLNRLSQSKILQKYIKVVLIHHPPLSNTLAARKSLLDPQPFVQWLKASDVDLVLHGHGHTGFRQFLTADSGKNIPVIGCPSCSSAESDRSRQAGFYVFTVHGAGSNNRISQDIYCFSAAQKTFQLTSSVSLTG